MDSPLVLTEVKNRIGYLTLNRPEKRNALSPLLVQELSRAFSDMEKDEGVKVVVLKAEGKAFCAGADLEYLQQLQNFSFQENLEDSTRLKDLFLQIYEFPKVVIAQVQGHALAGGCGLVTVCDFAFAVPEALFGFTEVKIGFVPALVSVFLHEKIGAGKANRLLLSGETISAEAARDFGMVAEVQEGQMLTDHVASFAQNLVESNSVFSMRETKGLLRAQGRKQRLESLEMAAELNARARAHADCQAGIAAFLSKTKPTW